MKKKVVSRLRLGLPFCLTLTAPTVALAQAIEGHVEDVVVSSEPEQPTEPPNAAAISQSQIEQVQSSPVTATIVTQEQLQAIQANDLQAAEKLEPALNIKFGNVRNIAINIRGFGAASSNATDAIFGGSTVYLNGVYQPFVGQAIFEIPDLAGIEVLKGPQATAGGQDNTGGVVKITTELPSFVTQEKGEFQYGSYNQFLFRGSATGAIADSDWAAFRLSIFGQDQEGYLDSTTSDEQYMGTHDKGALLQFLLKPNQDLTALLALNYSTVTQAQNPAGFAGVVDYYTNGEPVKNNFYARSARIDWPVPWGGTLLSTYTTSGFGWQNTAQDNYQASAKIDYNLNGFTINSVTAATEWEFHPHNGYTTTPGVPYDVGTGNQIDAKAVEEDFKVSAPKGGPLDVSAGTFLFWDLLVDREKNPYGPLAGAYYGSTSQPAIVNNTAYNYLMGQAFDNPSTKQIAPYAQSVWHATSDFDITTGVRYSYNYKDSYFNQWFGNAMPIPAGLTPTEINQIYTDRNGLVGAPRTWYAETHQGIVSALGTATYKFTPDVFGYVTVSQGGRAGGPNPATGNLPVTVPTTVLPERLDNYEVGVKSSWFDQRLLVNLDAYTMYDHNYITYESYVQGTTAVSYLANAQLADSRGVELDVRAKPIDGLQSYFSLVYDDAYFGSFTNSVCPFEVTGQTSCDLTGKPLALIPKFTVVGGAEYSHHLGNIVSEIVDKPVIGYFGADYTWQSSFYSGTDDSIYSKINPYGILDLHAGLKFEDGSWDLVGWAHNALNKHYFISVAASAPAGEITGSVGQPLMVGFTLRAKL
ncbi:MAG TPA: TonB-dependent receptor [Methylocella sp.]|nr:TonB-dependent receptor [Methylocella sp.]